MLVYITLGCLVYLLKQRFDIRSRDSQFADSLPVGREDELGSGRVARVSEHDKGGDCIDALLLTADMAEFIDKGAENLLWILNVDVWLGGWRFGGVFNGIDESLVKYYWFIEFKSGCASRWNWILCGQIQG